MKVIKSSYLQRDEYLTSYQDKERYDQSIGVHESGELDDASNWSKEIPLLNISLVVGTFVLERSHRAWRFFSATSSLRINQKASFCL